MKPVLYSSQNWTRKNLKRELQANVFNENR
jgi:hypothetical protein